MQISEQHVPLLQPLVVLHKQQQEGLETSILLQEQSKAEEHYQPVLGLQELLARTVYQEQLDLNVLELLEKLDLLEEIRELKIHLQKVDLDLKVFKLLVKLVVLVVLALRLLVQKLELLQRPVLVVLLVSLHYLLVCLVMQ